MPIPAFSASVDCSISNFQLLADQLRCSTSLCLINRLKGPNMKHRLSLSNHPHQPMPQLASGLSSRSPSHIMCTPVAPNSPPQWLNVSPTEWKTNHLPPWHRSLLTAPSSFLVQEREFSRAHVPSLRPPDPWIRKSSGLLSSLTASRLIQPLP